MVKRILVLDKNQEQCRDLCELLGESHYPATPLHSIRNLQDHLEEKKYLAVMVDIDTVPVDNRTIKDLTLKFPEVYLFFIQKVVSPRIKRCHLLPYLCLSQQTGRSGRTLLFFKEYL